MGPIENKCMIIILISRDPVNKNDMIIAITYLWVQLKSEHDYYIN